MDSNTARVVVVAIIGSTIAISMVFMAIAQIFSARRGKAKPEEGLARMEDRLSRMEDAIDAIAVEVERISESQRFTSRLLAEARPTGQEVLSGPIMGHVPPAEQRR